MHSIYNQPNIADHLCLLFNSSQRTRIRLWSLHIRGIFLFRLVRFLKKIGGSLHLTLRARSVEEVRDRRSG